ncbi:hypothetical protein M9458_050465, partial [Cirrhinus mrigala]
DHNAVAERLKFDVALNSVDDQYKGCRENMAKRVEYLKKELRNSDAFNRAWKK